MRQYYKEDSKFEKKELQAVCREVGEYVNTAEQDLSESEVDITGDTGVQSIPIFPN